jgi:hypothetical protein
MNQPGKILTPSSATGFIDPLNDAAPPQQLPRELRAVVRASVLQPASGQSGVLLELRQQSAKRC